jgi:hypothetical protein
MLIFLPAVAVVLSLALLTLVGEVGRPKRFEIPDGYSGWIAIQYADPACSPLRTSGVFLVIQISRSGRACTSSPIPGGWRYTRYDYVRENGELLHLPTGHRRHEISAVFSFYSPTSKREHLFIGTEQEFMQLRQPLD